jgi:hypothetical protein
LWGAFSPNGQWVAYQSDETGRPEIYVGSFPEANQKLRISVQGGHVPKWSKDSKELYYISDDRHLMAVQLRMGETIEASTPGTLFAVRLPGIPWGEPAPVYEVSDDGKRFLIAGRADDTRESHLRTLVVVSNWWSKMGR